MIATATHISRDHIRITVAEGYEVTLFTIQGTDVEAIVVAQDGTEAARLRVQAPKADERMTIEKTQDGSVDIFYARGN